MVAIILLSTDFDGQVTVFVMAIFLIIRIIIGVLMVSAVKIYYKYLSAKTSLIQDAKIEMTTVTVVSLKSILLLALFFEK
jgi:hypothetical protein